MEKKMKRYLTITTPLLIVLVSLLCLIFTGCATHATSTQTIVETNTIEVIQPITTTITLPITTTLPAVTLPQATTTIFNTSIVNVPSTITVTKTIPITTLIAPISNTLKWSNNFWCLSSSGADSSSQGLYTNYGINDIYGSILYVYQRLPIYWSNILQSNTIILYNASSEPLDDLAQWPTQYSSIFPFDVQQLKSIIPPFALSEPNANNAMSVIIVANSDSDIQTMLNVMISQPVPVGVMWTVAK
jgi:hypothetical protein